MEQYKGIPYGISSFKQLRREELYFVDKSQYIQKLENSGHFLFLIRPRRFGKSIFLNMLRAYYDLNDASVQIRKYADGQKVRMMIQHTKLHTIVVQIRGCELNRMEKIM
jgi:hypothetical protein